MANPYRLETFKRTAATSDVRIASLIQALTRTAKVLTADIEQEEECTGVRHLADPAYPMVARSLRARRANIEATITALEACLSGREMDPAA